MIVDFCKMETVRFITTCYLISLLSIKEENKILPFVAFLVVISEYIFEYVFLRLVCTCQTFYRYYFPNLLNCLSILPRTLGAETPLNDSNTKQHRHKAVITRKRWSFWKELYLHFSLQVISIASLSVVLELWITLYRLKTTFVKG